jgi:flagellar basal body-associated protein FliL
VTERLLLFILTALLAVMVLGTLWALTARPKAPPQNGGLAPETAQNPLKPHIFTEMGRVRARLGQPERKSGGEATVVISISFPYSDSDRAFLDELSLNVGKFRTATVDYFGAIPADSPLLTDEKSLKKDLLTRYNNMLRLGKVETLYFSEYVIID